MIKVTRCEIDQLTAEHITLLNKASFFTSIPFLKLWHNQKGKETFWKITENDEVLAIYPGVEFGSGKLKRFQAMPDGCYSRICFLSDNTEESRIVDSLLENIKKYSYFKVEIADYYNLFKKSSWRKKEFSTSLVKNIDENWFPPDKKIQSEIRKAERENVSCRPISIETDFKQFMSLVNVTEKRHNRKQKYSETFFKSLLELSKSDKRIVWSIAEHDESIVASHINFVLGKELLHWQSYSDRLYSSLKANQYLLTKTVQQTAKYGVNLLNFGSSPPDAESLIEYKKKYGAIEFKYSHLVHQSIIGRFFD